MGSVGGRPVVGQCGLWGHRSICGVGRLFGRSVCGMYGRSSSVGSVSLLQSWCFGQRPVSRTGRSVSLGRSVTSLQWVGRRTTRGPEMIVEQWIFELSQYWIGL